MTQLVDRLRTLITDLIGEETSWRWPPPDEDPAALLDENGAPVVPDKLTLLIYDADDPNKAIVLARTDILGAGSGADRGVLTTEGLVIFFRPEDSAILHGNDREVREALIEWEWGSGPVKKGRHVLRYTIQNLYHVPAS